MGGRLGLLWLGVLLLYLTPAGGLRAARGLEGVVEGSPDDGTAEGTDAGAGETADPTQGAPDPQPAAPGPQPIVKEPEPDPPLVTFDVTRRVTSTVTSSTQPPTEEVTVTMATETTTKELDACASSPCLNSGQCSPEGSTYKCLCALHNSLLYGGYRCEIKVAYEADVTRIEPEFGPEAGLTKITIHGSSLSLPLDGVYLGQGAERHRCHVVKKTGLSVRIHTPTYTTDTNRTLPLTLEFAGGLILPRPGQQLLFEYRQNPVIESIHPMETLSKGGTLLTIHGQHLDSVSKPEIKVIVVYRNNSTLLTRPRQPTETRMIFYQACLQTNRTSSLLLCRVPGLQIPRDFLYPDLSPPASAEDDILDFGPRPPEIEPETSTTEPISTTSATEQPPQKTLNHVFRDKLNVATENSVLEFHLGFVLDGVTSYNDLSQHPNLNQFGSLDVYCPPTVINSSSTLVYKPDMWLTIQGWHLLRGASASDYVVMVGAGVCEVSYVNDTALRCRLPEEVHTTSIGSQTHTILVQIGEHLEVVFGQIVYESTSKVPLIVGVVAGCLGLLVCLVVAVLVCRSFRRRRRGKSYRYGPVNHTLPPPLQMDGSTLPPPIQMDGPTVPPPIQMVTMREIQEPQTDIANGQQSPGPQQAAQDVRAPDFVHSEELFPNRYETAKPVPFRENISQNPRTLGHKSRPNNVYTVPNRRSGHSKSQPERPGDGSKRYANVSKEASDLPAAKPVSKLTKTSGNKRKAKTLPSSYRNMPLPGLPRDDHDHRAWDEPVPQHAHLTSHSDEEDDIYMNSPIKPRGLARVSGGRTGGNRHRFEAGI